MRDREYHEWRVRALGALRHATAEVRRLNVAIKTLNVAASAAQAVVDPTDPVSLIRAAANLLRKLRSEGVDFDPEEMALVSALEAYRPPTPAGGLTDAG